MEGARKFMAPSVPVTSAMSPVSRSDRGEDLEWVLESLHFSNDLLTADPIVSEEEVHRESEPLSRLMELRGKWETQITEDVQSFLKGSERASLGDVAKNLESLGLYENVNVITHVPVIPTTSGTGAVSTTPLAHNSFILVTPRDAREPLVVDPFFREKFTIARATPVYNTLVNEAVPTVAVGSLNKIRAIVCILSEKMARSFAKMGLELPPWRRLQAALSAWPSVVPEKSIQGLAKPSSGLEKRMGLPSVVVSSGLSSPPIRQMHGFKIAQEKSDALSVDASSDTRGTNQLAQVFHSPIRCARAA
eukprot:jgi/Mesvir1/5275/Mv15385-RA.1